MPERLVVTTPWFPSVNQPFSGAFVVDQVAAVRPWFDAVDVVLTEDWPTPYDVVGAKLAQRAYGRLIGGHAPRVPVQQRWNEHARATVWELPTPVRPWAGYASWARRHEWVARTALGGRVLDAPVVHGHTGMYGGWIATTCGRVDARVVVTEHASFLPKILEDAKSREMYRRVLERADAFFVVSSLLRGWLAEVFPDLVDRVQVCPNVVDTAHIGLRPHRVTDLRRWLYLGKFVPLKRVDLLLEAFAVVAAERGDAELTLVGSGKLEDELRARRAALGLTDRVHILPPVTPQEVPALLHAHDLLVHPSSMETFGMTTVEAVASGLPVLVTASGGPSETLAGIEQIAGEIVPVTDGVGDLLAGYHRLAARLDELDPEVARGTIARRYGPATIARTLLAAYTGREVSADAVTTVPSAPLTPPPAIVVEESLS